MTGQRPCLGCEAAARARTPLTLDTDLLTTLLRAQGITGVHAAAHHLDLTRSDYSRWWRGGIPHLDKALAACRILDVDPRHLWTPAPALALVPAQRAAA